MVAEGFYLVQSATLTSRVKVISTIDERVAVAKVGVEPLLAEVKPRLDTISHRRSPLLSLVSEPQTRNLALKSPVSTTPAPGDVRERTDCSTSLKNEE